MLQMRASHFLPLVWVTQILPLSVCLSVAGTLELSQGRDSSLCAAPKALSSSQPLKPVSIAVKERIGSIITRVPQPSPALVTVSLVLWGSASEEHSSQEAC